MAIPDAVDRVLPVFNTRKCRFACEPDKLETGRLVVFKQLGILNSYTFECSYFGSEFLRKGKDYYAKIYCDEFLEYINDRYLITPYRQDVYFDKELFKNAAADLMRGINLASKKKPLMA
jgi:hypothetical protein